MSVGFVCSQVPSTEKILQSSAVLKGRYHPGSASGNCLLSRCRPRGPRRAISRLFFGWGSEKEKRPPPLPFCPQRGCLKADKGHWEPCRDGSGQSRPRSPGHVAAPGHRAGLGLLPPSRALPPLARPRGSSSRREGSAAWLGGTPPGKRPASPLTTPWRPQRMGF